MQTHFESCLFRGTELKLGQCSPGKSAWREREWGINPDDLPRLQGSGKRSQQRPLWGHQSFSPGSFTSLPHTVLFILATESIFQAKWLPIFWYLLTSLFVSSLTLLRSTLHKATNNKKSSFQTPMRFTSSLPLLKLFHRSHWPKDKAEAKLCN